MKPRILLIVVVGSLWGCSNTEPPAGDQESIQGTWKVVHWEYLGSEREITAIIRWTFSRDSLAVSVDGVKASYEAKYKLNPSMEPKSIDLIQSVSWLPRAVHTSPKREAEAPKAVETQTVNNYLYGIYRLDGDRLQVCYGERQRLSRF